MGTAVYASVVVPVFNNAATLAELHRRIVAVLEARGVTFEILMVDDGSRDESWRVIAALSAQDARLRGLRLARNFGQHAAVCAGLDRIRGAVVLSIDADLQNAPEDFPALLDEFERGFEFVSGYRSFRRDSYFRRVLPSLLLNRLVQRVIHVPLRDYGCGINAVARRLAVEVGRHGEMRRFLKPLLALLADSASEVPVRHLPRGDGKSSYSLTRLLALQLDFFISFTRTPFQLVGATGLLMFAGGAVGGLLYLMILGLLGVSLGPRVQVLLLLVLVIGLQLSVLGLLGEYILRTYHVAQGQPLYVVRDDSAAPPREGIQP
ncbi:MAG: glycosyltransferase family 2 protein [Candidatus Schekmanbacteria bacterium]|nr:glycosyltransferase family 2 protein [Candidatus Schekmanbacteria bacterium]